jgi:hypothetical protein
MTREKAKLKRWEKEYSLPFPPVDKTCIDCRKLDTNRRGYYCSKWMKYISSNESPCRYYSPKHIKQQSGLRFTVDIPNVKKASKISKQITEEIRKMAKNRYRLSLYFPKKELMIIRKESPSIKLRANYKTVFIFHNPDKELLPKLTKIISDAKAKFNSLEIRTEIKL